MANCSNIQPGRVLTEFKSSRHSRDSSLWFESDSGSFEKPDHNPNHKPSVASPFVAEGFVFVVQAESNSVRVLTLLWPEHSSEPPRTSVDWLELDRRNPLATGRFNIMHLRSEMNARENTAGSAFNAMTPPSPNSQDRSRSMSPRLFRAALDNQSRQELTPHEKPYPGPKQNY